MKRPRFVAGKILPLFLILFAGPSVVQLFAQTWTQPSVTGGLPDPRSGHTAVYGPTRNRMIIFGGRNPTGMVYFDPLIGLRNDSWVLSNADGTQAFAPAWTALSPTGGPPSRRVGASSVYDPNNNRMIMFGGNPNEGSCFGTVNDVWVLSNADGTAPSTPVWTQLSPAGALPSNRWLHTAGYDPSTNRMIVFSGADACVPSNNEVWVLQNSNGLTGTPTWTQLNPAGTPPLPGSDNKGVYDPGSNRLIVVIGNNPAGLTDVRILTNANGYGATPPTWFDLSPTGGPPTAVIAGSTSLVYEPSSNRLIVFGGDGGSAPGGRLNEVWSLSNANGTEPSPAAWTRLSPTGGPPLARDLHTAVLNPANHRMTVFGGRACVSGGACTSSSEFSSLNDVWVLTGVNGLPATSATTMTAISAPSVSFGSYGLVTVHVTSNSGIPTGNVSLTADGGPAFTQTLDALGSFTFTLTGLSVGSHNLAASYVPTGNFLASNATGTLTVTQASQTITVTTPAPGTAIYNSNFTVAATGGASGNAVTFSSGGVCTNIGTTFTMTSGTGTCMVKFDQAGSTNYSAAPQVTQSTLATKIAPTVTFTGAPASAAYQSTFIVAATTNASTTPTITASGACSILANTVTMTSGTGACALSASWPADNNHLAATASQSTNAAKATPTITWGNPADLIFGEALTGSQLNATASFNASSLPGVFTYAPPAGTVLPVGVGQTLSVSFVPTDTVDFNNASASVVINVQPLSQAIQSLTGLVASFNLAQGINNSLDAKLQNVLAALTAANAGQRQDAINQLMAFISAVQAQSGKALTTAQANLLIAAAMRILAVL